MSDCCDDGLYVHAGDAWPLTFRYKDEGVPAALPNAAKLEVRTRDGAVLLTATIGDGLEFTDEVGVIEMLIPGDDTLLLAVGGKRTELTLGLKVYDASNEAETGETIVVREVVALPAAVTA